MNRRSFLTALIVTPVFAALVAACGDSSVHPADTTAPPPTTVPASIPHPNGADEMVLRIGYSGGFVAPVTEFLQTPTLLISGDGRAIAPAPVPAIYPGPLLTPFNQRTIDEAGVQAILAAAHASGLLAPAPDYSLPDGIGIADASDTVVVINANGSTYTHRAYALGIDARNGTSTPARDRLQQFVALVADLEKAVGAAHLGAEAPFVPTQYRLQARPADPAPSNGVEPTVVPWPVGTGVVLQDSSTCAVVDAAKVGALFASANQLTYFKEGDVVYQLTVASVLPGDTGC